MRTSSLLLLVVAFGCSMPLVAACSGRVLEPGEAIAGSAGIGESSGGGGASAGTSPGGAGSFAGAASSAGTSPGGATGSAGSAPLAGSGGVSIREPEIHRPKPVACDHTRPMNAPGAPMEADPNWVKCQSHAECTNGENGRCGGNGHDGYQCTYDSCFEDSDCKAAATGEPQLCACEGGFRSDNNVCLPGNCRVDADCGASGYCSPSLGSCGNYTKTVGYFCHTAQDECIDDADCTAAGTFGPGYCAFMPEIGHWKCSTAQCVG